VIFDILRVLEETRPILHGVVNYGGMKEFKEDNMENNNSFLVLFLAPVREYLEDDSVSEILINGHQQIYIERRGKLEEVPAKFVSEPALKAAASNIAKSVGRILDDMHPRLDARLPDGSRVHAVIPPLSRVGTVIAIRKFKKDTLTIDKMQEFGSLDETMRKLIRALVLLHKNVIVSGATSSGKTSVLNALSSYIPEGERVLVIEDATELQLQQKHIVPFETRKADKNGQGEVTIRDLIRSALRLRPDRIVIGEIRGGEALDLLQALNTGHAGSMSTIHANSPLDCLRRIETCALLSGIDIPLSALRSQVASAIDVVVHTARLSDGSRKVVSVAEVLPLENGDYRVSEIRRWKTSAIAPDGRVEGCFEAVNSASFVEQASILGVEM
jgi:pilus assembly protein CpaF